MKPHKRRQIAFMIGALSQNKKLTNLFDHTDDTYYQFQSSKLKTQLAIYDCTEEQTYNTHLKGPKGIYSFKTEKSDYYLLVEKLGSGFSGFDQETGQQIFAIVQETAISLYDFIEKKYYQYTVN